MLSECPQKYAQTLNLIFNNDETIVNVYKLTLNFWKCFSLKNYNPFYFNIIGKYTKELKVFLHFLLHPDNLIIF